MIYQCEACEARVDEGEEFRGWWGRWGAEAEGGGCGGGAVFVVSEEGLERGCRGGLVGR